MMYLSSKNFPTISTVYSIYFVYLSWKNNFFDEGKVLNYFIHDLLPKSYHVIHIRSYISHKINRGMQFSTILIKFYLMNIKFKLNHWYINLTRVLNKKFGNSDGTLFNKEKKKVKVLNLIKIIIWLGIHW